ncbi:hypothetical protein GCM10028803_06800 [Larkinella knui]|uniref:Uncharacterized protein n=1 Tax=Larkinella knui TaxID=2025310 RepID=A0A3P1CKQ0_9BACT|nr:hypothetical protein [Larkinella knui]RRB13646.1 hypothetical protein EHT87_15410 [Larkinella knui]
MKKLKKLLKLAGLGVLILLALMGIGIGGAGPIFSTQKDRYNDTGIRTELVEGKEDDSGPVESKEAR